MAIICEQINCKHLEPRHGLKNVCKCGAGYDYSGGDIKINKFGHCVSFEKREVRK